VAYGQLALSLLGVLVANSGLTADPTDTEGACIKLFNNMNGPLSILMLLFGVLPLFFITWEKHGLSAA
jgi:hypothetical protein